MKKLKSVYVVTKPLQYVNSINIPDASIQKECLLCDCFDNSDDFYSIIAKESSYFNNVLKFSNKYRAILFIIRHKTQYDNVYLDSDFGIILTFLLLLIKSLNIYTYEEGYGSYVYIRSNNTIKDKIANKINMILGSGNYSGGNLVTKGVYLYDVNLFKTNIKVQKEDFFFNKFQKPFIEHILSIKEIRMMYSSMEDKLLDKCNVLIYLSSWSISDTILDIIAENDSYYKILKLHPNIKGISKIGEYFDFVIPNNYLIEYFILKKLEIGSEVFVIHHGSFAMHYIKGFSNLKEKIIN